MEELDKKEQDRLKGKITLAAASLPLAGIMMAAFAYGSDVLKTHFKRTELLDEYAATLPQNGMGNLTMAKEQIGTDKDEWCIVHRRPGDRLRYDKECVTHPDELQP